MAEELKESGEFLYEALAGEIEGLIEAGTFSPGDKLLSVRDMAKQRSVSVTTVLEAYRLLEQRGRIEVRPQSGYYVGSPSRAGLPEPESCDFCDPSQVTVEELALQVLWDTQDPSLVQFGAAIPDPELLPTIRLNRFLINQTRKNYHQQTTVGVSRGCEELRAQVAKYQVAAGCRLSPDDIVITAGCLEAVGLSLRAVCSPGDTVAVESPTYFGILQALESQGLRALEIPAHPVTGLSLEALNFALENQPVHACVVMTNFSNPLGVTMPDENKKALVEILSRRNIPLIEDDIHSELFFSGKRPLTAKSFDRNDSVLLCSSFSKDLSPSYRVGWVAPGRYQDRVERLKMSTNISTALLPQLAIAEFLESGGYTYHLRKIRRAYGTKMARMSQSVMASFPEGTRISSPAGGFVLWVQLPENVDSLVLYRKALAEGITFVPGYIFSPGDKYRNYIRLNTAYWSEKTDPALGRLGALVSQLAG